MNDEILAELKKLNANMERLLCFQKFAAMRYADKNRATVGQPAGSDVEREGSVSIVPVSSDGADPVSGNA